MTAAEAGAAVAQLSAAAGNGSQPARLSRLPRHREAEPFEDLRDASDRHRERTMVAPTAFLASVGTVSEHRPRTDFVRNLLAAGGVRSVAGSGFATAAEAAAAMAASGSSAAVICSSDERYPELVPELAAALKKAGAHIVLVAGRPTSSESSWREAGVDDFLYAGCDAIATLKIVLQTEGVELG